MHCGSFTMEYLMFKHEDVTLGWSSKLLDRRLTQLLSNVLHTKVKVTLLHLVVFVRVVPIPFLVLGFLLVYSVILCREAHSALGSNKYALDWNATLLYVGGAAVGGIVKTPSRKILTAGFIFWSLMNRKWAATPYRVSNLNELRGHSCNLHFMGGPHCFSESSTKLWIMQCKMLRNGFVSHS